MAKHEVYLHLNNGGITLGVVATEFGPAVTFEAFHMGHQTNGAKVITRPAELKAIGEMFLAASQEVYADPGPLLDAAAIIPD